MLNSTTDEKVQGKTLFKNLVDTTNTLEIARLAHERYLLKNQHEDLLEAVNQYLQTMKTNPTMAESYYRLASLMLESGDIDLENAIIQCKTAISLAPQNSNAHLYTAYFLEKASNFESASEEFEKAIKCAGVNSSRARLLYSSSILKRVDNKYTHIGNLHKFLYYFVTGMALSVIDKASIKMLYKNIKESALTNLFKTVGAFFEGFKNYGTTLNIYKKAIKATGKSSLFNSKMGDILMKRKEYNDALACYREAYSAQPQDRNTLLKLATITRAYLPEEVDETIDYYSKLLEFGVDLEKIYYELGHLYLKKDDSFHALVAFKLALDADENNPYYNNAIAFAYLRSNMFDDAIKHYQKAIKINPDDRWTALVCHTLGLLYLDMKMDFQSAISAFQAGIALDSENYELHIALADVYVIQSDLDSAIQTYCEAIAIDAENYLAYAKMGLALWEKGCSQEATISFSKSIDLNPSCDIAYNNLGVVKLDAFAESKEALECFLTAIELNPNYTMAYFNAGRAYETMGEAKDAASYYQMAIDLNRLNPELSEDDIKDKIHSLFNL